MFCWSCGAPNCEAVDGITRQRFESYSGMAKGDFGDLTPSPFPPQIIYILYVNKYIQIHQRT